MNTLPHTGFSGPFPAKADAGELGPAEFARVRALAEREAGLSIPEAKRSMVQSRLSRRLRATGHPHFAAYLDHVETASGAVERGHMISALTTNVSHFFREAHHFETLADTLLPEMKGRAEAGHPVRIWSAGCSSGQEPYTIAMTVLDRWPAAGDAGLRILATDIDRAILSKAVAGRYERRMLSDVPEHLQRRFFDASGDDHLSASHALRSLITFRPLNLVDAWPMRQKFDAIFCRNVVIYFSDETQRRLWPRFADALRPDGWFFLGHSERVAAPEQIGLTPSGVTSYRKGRSAASSSNRSNS